MQKKLMTIMAAVIAQTFSFWQPMPACQAAAPPLAGIYADIVSVTAAKEPGGYGFMVTVASPDQGCNRYANWWEVLSEDGRLLYRRILGHSHTDEQPFLRGGGPAAITAETVLIIRAHMQPEGYGGKAFKGSVKKGFQQVDLSPDFAAGLARVEPLPEHCAW